jgi:uncharacterized protein YbjT (DUF2867 family)
VVDRTRSILLAGATGLVGKHCVKALLAQDELSKLTVLSRRELPYSLPSEQTKKLDVQLVDFDLLSEKEALFNVDAVVCCLGTTIKQAGSIKAFKKVDYEYCLELARIAKKNNVEHFSIVTAVNAKPNSLAYYAKTKGELENELKKMAFPHLFIFKPSLLLGERDSFRLGEGVFGKASGLMNALLPKSKSSLKAIEAEVVGKAMAFLTLNPDQSDGGAVELLHYDQMQALAKVLN